MHRLPRDAAVRDGVARVHPLALESCTMLLYDGMMLTRMLALSPRKFVRET